MTALTFVDLYSTNGLAQLVGEDATDAAVATQLRRTINDEYVKYAAGPYWWNLREQTYTPTSTPALPAVNTRYVTMPTDTDGAVFDRAYRLGYRYPNLWTEIELVEDDEWLTRSLTPTQNAGFPRFCRLIRTASVIQLELDRPVSQQFLDAVGTVLLEYFAVPARMVADGDVPVLPDTLRPYVITLAGCAWAMQQSDWGLYKALITLQGRQRTSPVEEAIAARMRHDLQRTGKARTIRPKDDYSPSLTGMGARDYGRAPY